jgi:hypothetical protein
MPAHSNRRVGRLRPLAAPRDSHPLPRRPHHCRPRRHVRLYALSERGFDLLLAAKASTQWSSKIFDKPLPAKMRTGRMSMPIAAVSSLSDQVNLTEIGWS